MLRASPPTSWSGRHEPHVQPHRRVGRVPSVVAPRERQGPLLEARARFRVPHGALRRVRRRSSPRFRTAKRTLLDNSLLMYGSNMSNSDRHNNYPLPNILVGGGCGALRAGSTSTLPEHTTLANLHLTVREQGRPRAEEPSRQHGRDRGRLSGSSCRERATTRRAAGRAQRHRGRRRRPRARAARAGRPRGWPVGRAGGARQLTLVDGRRRQRARARHERRPGARRQRRGASASRRPARGARATCPGRVAWQPSSTPTGTSTKSARTRRSATPARRSSRTRRRDYSSRGLVRPGRGPLQPPVPRRRSRPRPSIRTAPRRSTADASSTATCSRRTPTATSTSVFPRLERARGRRRRVAARDPALDWFGGGWLGGRVDSLAMLLELGNATRVSCRATGRW